AGSVFEVDVMTDGKTGGFLDQAENHARAAEYVAPGAEALDAFTYHGGFALALARGGAVSVLALDEAAPAVGRGRQNGPRNQRAPPAAWCSSSSGAAPGATTRRFSACPKPSI